MKFDPNAALSKNEQRVLIAIIVVTAIASGVTAARRLRPEWFYGEPDLIAGEHRELSSENNAEEESPVESKTLLDINRATPAQLRALPGIGPTLAERIIVRRAESGGFASVEELRSVTGIGEKRMETLRSLVTVGADGRHEGEKIVE